MNDLLFGISMTVPLLLVFLWIWRKGKKAPYPSGGCGCACAPRRQVTRAGDGLCGRDEGCKGGSGE